MEFGKKQIAFNSFYTVHKKKSQNKSKNKSQNNDFQLTILAKKAKNAKIDNFFEFVFNVQLLPTKFLKNSNNFDFENFLHFWRKNNKKAKKG